MTGSSSMVILKNSLPLFVTGKSSKFGIVVIQEWWGLNDQIKAITQRISESGNFKAVAPDLYHGKKTAIADEANHLMSSLDWNGAMNDIKSAADYLKTDQGCEKIAVLGFCMGGALSIASAVKLTGIDAAVCFYGIPGRDFAKIEEIKCPIQCHFGEKDNHTGFSDVKSVNILEEYLKKQNNHIYEINRYADADHAFMNESRPEVYKPEAAKLAMERSIAFINKVFSQ